MNQVVDVDGNDNVLSMHFFKKNAEAVVPGFDTYEAVKEAVESFDFDRALKELSREEEGPVIDLTLGLPKIPAEEIREMSTVEVFLNISQNLKNLQVLMGKMKYYLDELESIEKTVKL